MTVQGLALSALALFIYTERMKRIKVPPATPAIPLPSPTEQTELTGHGPKAVTHVVRPTAVPSTQENEMMVASAYPQLGDEVRVDVDRVPIMQRTALHNRVVAASVHGQLGRVIGTEIQAGVYMLKIETAQASMWVPADAVALEAHPVAPVENPSASPDRMRKPSTGAYKLT